MNTLYKKFLPYTLLLLIILIGAFFRLYNINWDMGFHLHPDERFLTMVGIKETLPTSIFEYLNPLTSPFNPSVLGFGFFVYGVLPLTLNVLLSLLFHTQDYALFTLQGRVLSGIFDILSLLVIFALAALFEKEFHFSKKVKYFSAFFYAIAVLPIQLSHFFTVDIFLSFFMLASVYCLLRFIFYRQTLFLILSGIALGMAIACKVSAIAIIPLDIVLLLLPYITKKHMLKGLLLTLLIFLISSYCSLKISDPYLFASGNFLDARMSTEFLHSVQTLSSYANPNSLYPPNIQWANKLPVVFSLFNIAFFGLGIGIFLFTIVGIAALFKTKKAIAITLALWVILFFLFQSVQYVKTMRYFIYLYPFFALFAGIGFAAFIKRKPHILLILVSIFLIVAWPLSYLSIYTKPHTRVVASNWIGRNAAPGSTILGEYWDDTLPLTNTNFSIIPLHVFDADTNEKWNTLSQQLRDGDYLVLSSNRGWASIASSKNLYPKMSKWYNDLFAGKLPYKKIAEFASYPSLTYLGIPVTIKDNMAEEAFTVYDHPTVMIFKNTLKE